VAKLLGDRMGRDIYFYSISIDPEHDTPAVLKAYSEKVSGRARLAVPHRQEGRDRDDQPEAGTLLAARSVEPGRAYADAAHRQRRDGAVDAHLGDRQPEVPVAHDRRLV
jgi:hypothetical protein